MTITVERIAELLDVSLTGAQNSPDPTDLPGTQPVPDPLPEAVQEALSGAPPTTDDGRVDRSGALYRLVAVAAECGLSEGQALWLAQRYGPAVDKRPDPEALARDVVRSYRRVRSGLRIEAEPIGLDAAHTTFRRWLGQKFDIDAVDAILATLAAHLLPGDPVWLLIVSGSGNAKTEVLSAAAGAGAVITSKITSEGALLSATPAREKAQGATGGLLRRIGSSGVLGIKDVTSILEMDRNARGGVLAGLREIHDGFWERNVGTDGGVSLTWRGRITVLGAVTTAWDRAREVIAAMGDRFVLLRVDSTVERISAGRQSIHNIGSEPTMRSELASAVAGVLASVDTSHTVALTDAESERLLRAADVATRGRTGVDFDYRGDVIDSHAPEMPTRFAKQLAQLVRGGIAVGMTRPDALRLAVRCAADSLPPLRLAILRHLVAHPHRNPTDLARELGKPRATVIRQVQALHVLGLLIEHGGKFGTNTYAPHPDLDVDALVVPSPEK